MLWGVLDCLLVTGSELKKNANGGTKQTHNRAKHGLEGRVGKVDSIKANIRTTDLVVEVTGQEIKGPDGQGRYLGLCPFHEDTSPSLRVFEDGGFLCFSCSAEGGSVIDFWQMLPGKQGISDADAISELAARLNGSSIPLRTQAPRVKQRPEVPAPPAVDFTEEQLPRIGDPVNVRKLDGKTFTIRPNWIHVYRRTDGTPRYVVFRIDETDDKRKTFIPCRWSGSEWWAVGDDQPRGLYGLEQLNAAAQVLLVEGEKAADRARPRVAKAVAMVTWPGGAKAVECIDWSPLEGRRVLLWPDNDEPGREAMHAIGRLLQGKVETLRYIDPREAGEQPSKVLPEKGDAADMPADVDMMQWLKGHASDWVDPSSEPLPEEVPTFATPEQAKGARTLMLPFHVLGQKEGRAYFLKAKDGRMVSHSLTGIPRKEVLGTLAPPHVWKDAFVPNDPEATVSWAAIGQSAQAHIMEIVEQKPEFNPEDTRGRGCWPHNGSIAFNRGDLVSVAGVPVRENYIDGTVYERGKPLPVRRDRVLTSKEGSRLLRVIEDCTWIEAHAATLLAGWIALGPICGALVWRPHVWITGPSGSGKTTIVDEIVGPALGAGMHIRLGGNTTEAGLRQTIGKDALPVLIDEAESDSTQIAQILGLARSASSGDVIVRGTPGQDGAIHYHIRSGFCLSAINPAIAKHADESRISRLALMKGQGEQADADYLAMRDEIANLIDPQFGYRLAARMIGRVDQVVADILLIEDAITHRFGSRRLAQQYGALLAGVWSLTMEDPIDEANAVAMANTVPESTAEVQLEDDDASQMLNYFLSWKLDVPGKKGGHVKMSLGELIEQVAVPTYLDQDIFRDEAEDVLKRCGVRCEGRKLNNGSLTKVIVVAKKHPELIRLFRDTTWQYSYDARFKDFTGAVNGGQVRWSTGRFQTVVVPLRHFTITGE